MIDSGYLDGIEAVIFDVDGTLIDSMGMWKNIDVVFLARRNLPMPDDLQARIEGMNMTQSAEWFIDFYNLDESVQDLKDEWNKMAIEAYEKDIRLKPLAYEFISLLKSKGIKTGIATSNSTELMHTFLEANKLSDLMDVACSGCMVEKGKPAPDIYLHAALALGVDPSKCLVIEDIVKGIEAGKAAGMRTVAIDDFYSADQRKEKMAAADYYVYGFDELIAAIN